MLVMLTGIVEFLHPFMSTLVLELTIALQSSLESKYGFPVSTIMVVKLEQDIRELGLKELKPVPILMDFNPLQARKARSLID